MTETITVTEAARNFSDVVNKVYYRGESLLLTRGGKVVARLVPAAVAEAPIGRQLAEAWKTLPHLSAEEAEAFAKDVERARESLNQAPASVWD